MSEETRKKEHKEKHLEKLTVKELRKIAAEIPHARAIHDMHKEELVAFIKETRGIEDGTLAKTKTHAVKIKMTKPELKARIRELKIFKMQASESNENKKAAMLRYQISQLKKKSRRVATA
ncbi:MAG: hypothetical protein WC560_09005 [Syntrophales bacterium]